MVERVAFYAPLKSPRHPVPSGDRRMARALMRALQSGGHQVELASRLRSFDRDGDHQRQRRIRKLGERVADRLIDRYGSRPRHRRPTAWITYHAYHKSPDWLGPAVRDALNLPYILIEASFAPKQAGGPWDLGHRRAEASIRAADVTLAMTGVDEAGLQPLIEKPAKLERLPPFLDPTPYRAAHDARARHRRDMTRRFGLRTDRLWLLTVAMMRDDVKRTSYALLAEALKRLDHDSWQLLIVGDGPSRSSIEKLFESFGPERVKFAGFLDESDLPACYAAADVYAWPAVREAYGMAFLEAQAAGLPVVAGREGGVQDVVRHGQTGILTTPGDPVALASAVGGLLRDSSRRHAMSVAGSEFVDAERSLAHASDRLTSALADAASIFDARAECSRVGR